MSGLTGSIEKFLKDLLSESGGAIEIGRNDLANHFDCAPSQINYVLSTRFTPYRGYYIESKRGGSGYIKIIELDLSQEASIKSLVNEGIGQSITQGKAVSFIQGLEEKKIVTSREALLMRHAVDDNSLINVPVEQRNKIRADILKNMLIVFLR